MLKYINILFIYICCITILGCHCNCVSVIEGPEVAYVAPQKETAKVSLKDQMIVDASKINKGKKSQNTKQKVNKKEEKSILEDVFAQTELKAQRINVDLSLDSKSDGAVGIPHIIKCKVKNQGDTPIGKYQIKTVLPPALSYEEKEAKPIVDFSDLAVDGVQELEVKVVANRLGVYTIEAQVIYNGEVVDNNSININFKHKSDLELKLDGPISTNIESQFEYTITIINTGQITLSDVLVQDQLGKGIIYIASTPEGKNKEKFGKTRVTWNLGDLLPQEQKVLKIKVTAISKGVIFNRARVKDGRDLVNKNAEIKTEIVGAIGLQIEHYDTEDPIAVGEETTYIVKVTNEGLKTVRNINLVDILPQEVSFVDSNVVGSSKPIKKTIDGTKIVFDTIESLAPGKELIFKIRVKSVKAGDLLNSVKIKCQDFEKTITKQEATTSYSK